MDPGIVRSVPTMGPSDLQSIPLVLWRGVTKRCPSCGAGRLFASWFKLGPTCHGCGMDFDREPGWWIGAIIMNTAGAELVFGAYFAGGLVLTWPEVPWTPMMIGGLVLMAVFPVFFYPFSKTLWLAVDVLLHRMDESIAPR